MGDNDPPPPPPGGYLKCVKVSLKHILKNPQQNLPKLNERVVMANKIVIHTLQFMKLYLLDLLRRIQEGERERLPKITKKFVTNCMKILCTKCTRGAKPKGDTAALQAELRKFYSTY